MYALCTWLPCDLKRFIFIVPAASPRNVPRTSPRFSHLATPLSQRYFYLPASPFSASKNFPTNSSSAPLTPFLHYCTPATPQNVTAKNPYVMQLIMHNKHMAGRHQGEGES